MAAGRSRDQSVQAVWNLRASCLAYLHWTGSGGVWVLVSLLVADGI
jgi:hypothetical protein